MVQNNARYIRLVDRQPASLRYTEAGDVPGGIEVGMEFEPASEAFISQAVARPPIDVPAPGTLLTSVTCVYVEHGLPDAFGLVIDEGLKLADGPVSERPIEILPQSLHLSDAELFQRYRIERLYHYPIGHLMVHIGHKAVLLPRQAFEFTPSGAGAFGLKFVTKMLILAFDRTDARGTIELIAGKHSVIENARIDAENGIRRSDARRSLIHDNAKDQMLSVEGQLGGYDLPLDIFLEVSGNDNGEFHTSHYTCQGNVTFAEFGGKGTLIISYGGPSPLDRETLQFLSLEHLGGIVPCGSDQGSGNARITLTNWIVGKMVKLQLVYHFCFETDDKNIISSGINGFDGLDKSFVSGKVQSDGTLHESSLDSVVLRFFTGLDESETLQFLPSLGSVEILGGVI